MIDQENDKCWNCGKDLGFKLIWCCGGRECGCMGLPIDVPYCSDECVNEAYYKKNNPEHTAPEDPMYYLEMF